jgi:hypothetical protein
MCQGYVAWEGETVARGEVAETEASGDKNIGGGHMGDRFREVRGRSGKGEGQAEW